MLGLGKGLPRADFYVAGSGNDWTVTAGTTPSIALSGAVRATLITLAIDNANDWTGTLSDYSLTDTVVTNETDGTSSNIGLVNFTADLGAVGGIRFIQTSQKNFQSLVGAGSGETIRVTGDLTLDGYASVELTNTITY